MVNLARQITMHTDTFLNRFRIVLVVLSLCAGIIVYKLVSFQIDPPIPLDPPISIVLHPPRGNIYDRNGRALAINTVYYKLGINYDRVQYRDHDDDGEINIAERQSALESVALKLARALDQPYENIVRKVTEDTNESGQLLKHKTLVSFVSSDSVEELYSIMEDDYYYELSCLSLDPVLLRNYPNGSLAAHVLGLVHYNQIGYYGVEDYYNGLLSGDTIKGRQPVVPFDVEMELQSDVGADIYLTLDREVQFAAEEVLASSIAKYAASAGTIIVSEPRTGEILAMASLPNFDPNDVDALLHNPPYTWHNPAVSDQFEPGSVFKILTMAAALQSGMFTPNSTYIDNGHFEYGGILINNWDGRAWGLQDMTGLLSHSLNVGAATLSTTLGPQQFYDYVSAFGIGRLTNIDAAGEERGHLRRPGDSDWHDSDLATNSFGQGVATTSLQMITAVSAIANGGAIMHPHLLREVHDGDAVYNSQPQIMSRPVSREVAQTLSDMLANSLAEETKLALVDGYSLVGKTGTASIPMPYGYDPDRTIASFIGWGPAEDPRFIVFVKLDAPTPEWGSLTAAPTFSDLVKRLVVLMDIPPDAIRRELASSVG